MAFKDHFSKLASPYAQFRPSYPASLFDYLARSCARRQLAWDCACGSGQATLAVAERFAHVVASDASAQQLAAAPPRANITYRLAPADCSGIQTDGADLITVAQALHWFDLEGFYREAARVLCSSGLLAVWTYSVVRSADDKIDALIQEFYHETVGPYWPPERRLVEEGYRSLPLPFEELAPPAFFMREEWEREHFLGYVGTWSATACCLEQSAEDPVSALRARLGPLWQEGQKQVVTWPLALRVSRKP